MVDWFPFYVMATTPSISNIRSTANRAEQSADRNALQLREMQDHIERLSLACSAMWSLLRQSTSLTDEDLARRIQELDLSDGSLDGKIQLAARECPSCHRAVRSRRSRCLYCGHELQAPGPFGTQS